MSYKEYTKGFRLFWKAMKAPKSEMWVSVEVLIAITLVLSFILFLVEHLAQPEVYSNYWDALIWNFMRYIGDPGKFADYGPVTVTGRILDIVVSIVNIAIFAIPAGILASGFSNAIAADKRENELNEFHGRVIKAFRRKSDKRLREYIDSCEDKDNDDWKTLNMVPSFIPVWKLQARQGMDMKDVIDTCAHFDDLRFKNLAQAYSDDTDHGFVVEHFPLNTDYGCFINRKSRVTIVSPSSFDDIGTGWFTYYLAKFGGFNYISKDLEIDADELDSFLNISKEPLCDKKTKAECLKSNDRHAISVIDKKASNRKSFLNDIGEVCQGEDHWTIIVSNFIKQPTGEFDFHISCARKDGTERTVTRLDEYKKFCEKFTDTMLCMNMKTSIPTTFYTLNKNNLAYVIRDRMGWTTNSIVVRPSTDAILLGKSPLLVAFRFAKVITETLAPESKPLAYDVKDLKATAFGYNTQLTK